MTEAAQGLLKVSLEWMDQLWDERLGLLRNPDYGNCVVGDQTTMHLVRETCWYALGLLLRGTEGDSWRAQAALYAVLEHQFDEPGTAYHGSFRRSPEEPSPPAEPVMWRDYDPNWRQFIGTGLALVLRGFEQELPEDLLARIEQAIQLTVEGEPPDRVSPAYSNIALMKAWLEAFVGQRFGDRSRAQGAMSLAREIQTRFQSYGAFEEYNSPTYYGIDLYALALWRSCVVAEPLKNMGSTMEAALWRDIARYYHAGLKNLAGPYDRSYGMDMTRYAAMLGLWIWAAHGPKYAPFPDPQTSFDHAADFCFAPCVAALGAAIPSDVENGFRTFEGKRQVSQTIAASPLRIATTWLSASLMIGAEHTSSTRVSQGQFHGATAHWRTPSQEVAWLRLRSEIPVDAKVTKTTLQLSTNSPQAWTAQLEFSHSVITRNEQGNSFIVAPGVSLSLSQRQQGRRPHVTTDGNRVLIGAAAGDIISIRLEPDC